MFLHYLKIAIRNLLKNKTQSIISIVGLAVSFVCISLSAIWIRYETTYDTSHPNAKNICRIIAINDNHPNGYNVVMPAPLSSELKQDFPEIEAASTVRFWAQDQLLHDNNIIDECYTADAEFFDVFSVQFVLGNKKTAFIDQYSVVLSESTAIELFGSPEKAMGANLKSKNWQGDYGSDYTITGVIKGFKHSNLRFKAITKFIPTRDDNWDSNSFATFALLKKNINSELFQENLYNAEFAGHVRYYKPIPISEPQYKYKSYEQLHVLPFTYIIVLTAISLLLFACALINYLSLFMSLMLTRLKDLGLRKALGARNKQLFLFLITEFIFTMLMAFFLGGCIIEIARPLMENATGIEIDASVMLGVMCLFTSVGVVLSIVVVSFPIWRVCNIVVKTNITGKSLIKRQKAQKVLIAIQLIISIFLLFITSVMYSQLHFMREKDLGFSRKNVLNVKPQAENANKFTENINIICEGLSKNTSIQDVLVQGMDFFAENGASTTVGNIKWEGKNSDSRMSVAQVRVDYDFADFFNIPIKEGRFFSKEFTSDSDKMVINEMFANIIGNPIGKKVDFQGANREVIGVIADFHDRSLKHEALPTGILLQGHPQSLYIRVVPNKLKEGIEHINLIFEQHSVLNPTIQSMDDLFNEFSKTERIMMYFIGIITIICLIVSIFGIYSLTLYSMEHRRREVAIRKVMSADVNTIVRMFFKEYIGLVIVASIIAIPPAYYIINKWLQDYANRVNIAWWLIAITLLFVLLIVTITVLRQIVKAANSNPADVIKYE